MSIFWINRGWQTAFIGYCPDKKSWDKQMQKMGHKNEPYPDSAGRCTVFTENEKCIILITFTDLKALRKTEAIGLIVHEVTHAFEAVCENMKEQFPSPEFKAYSHQALTQLLIEALKKKGKFKL